MSDAGGRSPHAEAQLTLKQLYRMSEDGVREAGTQSSYGVAEQAKPLLVT